MYTSWHLGCWAEKPVTSSSQNKPRSDSKHARNTRLSCLGAAASSKAQGGKRLEQTTPSAPLRRNCIPRSRKPRSFESKLRKHCTSKLDGALRKSTLYIWDPLWLKLRCSWIFVCGLAVWVPDMGSSPQRKCRTKARMRRAAPRTVDHIV